MRKTAKDIFYSLLDFKDQPVPVILLCLLIASCFSWFVKEFFEIGATRLGAGFDALLGVVFVVAFTTLVIYYIKRNQKKGSLAELSEYSQYKVTENLSVDPITTVEDLKAVQALSREIFGEANPDDEEVVGSLDTKYPRSIGLYSHDEKRYVGYATFWPISEATANDLLNGRLKETDMTRSHILSGAEQYKCRYAYIPGVAVRDHRSGRGRKRTVVLLKRFLWFVYEQFFSDGQRKDPIKVIAIGYSDPGENLCANRLKMERQRLVDIGEPEKKWIYARDFSAKDWLKIIQNDI